MKGLRTNRRKFLWTAVLFSASIFLPLLGLSSAEQHRVSRPGLYQGYSKELYDCCERESLYVTMPTDGTKLAVDIYMPVEKGTAKAAQGPFPVLLTTTRYHRSNEVEGKVVPLQKNPILSYAALFVRYGYVVAIADVRGAGASFGVDLGPFSKQETEDSHHLIQWLARRQWSTGKVGMFGLSYLGITQLKAASTKPPALKAIFPQVAFWDMYSFVYQNGVFLDDFLRVWGDANVLLDANILLKKAHIYPTARVDADEDGSMRKAASLMHGANYNVFEEAMHARFRDSVDSNGVCIWEANSPHSYRRDIEDSNVAIYTLGGWFDGFTRDIFIPFLTLSNPQKVVVGPWDHISRSGFDMAMEHIRWFDYHLKGIQNGIMDEPPITYYTINATPGTEWRTSWTWPPRGQRPNAYYLREGKSGSIKSVNDGILSPEKPSRMDVFDQYQVDYSTTTGKKSRWYATAGLPFEMPDRTPQDKKALTYTTEPLDGDLEVTGNPVVNLWISASTADVDVFVYLEDVDVNGFSHYVTEGKIRASMRAVSYPPYAFMGLPFHRCNAEDVDYLEPGEPVKLSFALLATSYVFRAGHRIRITITGADKDNFYTPERPIPPTINLFRSKSMPSHVILPITRH